MSVDLPAPFSPSRAWISPFLSCRVMSSFCSTPGKLLGDVKHFDHIRRSVVHTATYFPISVSVFAYRQPPDWKPRCPAREMAFLIFRLYLFDRLISRYSAPNVYRMQTKERKPSLSLSPGENPEFFTRAETPPAGRQWISSEAGPSPLGLPRGAQVCTRRGCSGANKKRRESQSFLSARAKTRSFSPGPRPARRAAMDLIRGGPSPPWAPPRRTGLHTARLFRGKQEKERKRKLSLLRRVRSNYLTRLRVT